LRDAQRTILRLGAEETINPETEQVNPVALSRFVRRNAATLEKFPELRADLQDAVTAQQRLRAVNDANSIETRAHENSLVFRAVLGNEETPGGAVAVAIGEPGSRPRNPVEGLNQLIKNVNTAGDLAPQARAGLRDAVLDRAIVYATGEDGQFNFGRFRNFLLRTHVSQPAFGGGRILRDGGIFTDVELTQLNRLLTEADNIQQALDAGGPRLQETVIDAPAAAVDLVVRIAGSALGTSASRVLERVIPGYTRGGGQGLIEAQAGSALAQNMFKNMPQTYFRDLLNEAIAQPEVMADLLERGVNQSARRRTTIDRRINAFLINAGLQPAREEIEDAHLFRAAAALLRRRRRSRHLRHSAFGGISPERATACSCPRDTGSLSRTDDRDPLGRSTPACGTSSSSHCAAGGGPRQLLGALPQRSDLAARAAARNAAGYRIAYGRPALMDPILLHHYQNLAQDTAVKNEDGSVSTVYTRQVDINGRPTLIPSVWDGKILDEEQAVERALTSGVQWPTANTHEELRAYDEQLHQNMRPMAAEEAAQLLKMISGLRQTAF
jgi:hypothetical protein